MFAQSVLKIEKIFFKTTAKKPYHHNPTKQKSQHFDVQTAR